MIGTPVELSAIWSGSSHKLSATGVNGEDISSTLDSQVDPIFWFGTVDNEIIERNSVSNLSVVTWESNQATWEVVSTPDWLWHSWAVDFRHDSK